MAEEKRRNMPHIPSADLGLFRTAEMEAWVRHARKE
jgi:hypothetical protein